MNQRDLPYTIRGSGANLRIAAALQVMQTIAARRKLR
jgi:hypothetical protein